jgi:hypothetical protein
MRARERYRICLIIAYSFLLEDIYNIQREAYRYIHEKYLHHYGNYWIIGRMADSILGYFEKEALIPLSLKITGFGPFNKIWSPEHGNI